jgi:hypothetical protein
MTDTKSYPYVTHLDIKLVHPSSKNTWLTVPPSLSARADEVIE